MEGEKFSWFAKNYLRKRPRLSPTSIIDEQMASTSACMPSTSSTSNSRTRVQRILIEPTDEQLLKWQERQISECIVENTVNQMVESYLTFIEGENVNSPGSRNEVDREAHIASYHAYRAQENFEDSAILWAIDQHGLQHNHQFFNDNQTETMSTSSSSISLSSPPHLPSQDELIFFKNTENNNQEADSESTSNTQTYSSQESQCNSIRESNELKLKQDNDTKRSDEETNESVQQTSQTEDEQAIDEHFDFMEAAVAVAIQEKGLVSYTMQKSPNR